MLSKNGHVGMGGLSPEDTQELVPRSPAKDGAAAAEVLEHGKDQGLHPLTVHICPLKPSGGPDGILSPCAQPPVSIPPASLPQRSHLRMELTSTDFQCEEREFCWMLSRHCVMFVSLLLKCFQEDRQWDEV